MIINPTQNQMAFQFFQKWIEKIAANANTAELDALELTQLQKLLGTIINTSKSEINSVTVLPTGYTIEDTMSGVLSLTIPVTEDEGEQVFPPVTIVSWLEHKLIIDLKFVSNANTTFGDVSTYIRSMISGFNIPFNYTYLDNQITNYLDSISTLPYVDEFEFLIEIDFHTGLHKFDVLCSNGLPKLQVPGVGEPSSSNITAAAADLTCSYLFDNTDSIVEVGFEYGTSLESLTESADETTTSPFTSNLTGLTANTEYIAIPYVKYDTDKMQRGKQITFTTLAE